MFVLQIFRRQQLYVVANAIHTILPGATRSQLKSGYLLHNCMNKLYNKSTTRSSAIADGPRDASCQLKSCQLPRNSTETTCTTTPEQIEVMKLEDYSGPMCNKHVHSTMMRLSRFHCPIGVINKPPKDELWISPVAKFSKSTM